MNQTATGNVGSGDAALPVLTLPADDYDAVLFDLDGVLANTVSIHAAAWKQAFDEFLHQHAAANGEAFVPFDPDADYRLYVDGKPRRDGIVSFLHARGIELPMDAPDTGPAIASANTTASASAIASVRALGHLKTGYFLERLAQTGVEPCHGALELVRALRDRGIKTAVVSSSKNCKAVLEATNMTALFDARVDGVDVTRLALRGKPAPDGFLEAARRLGVEPSRAVVIEDALAGVAAGRAGRFGMVIGVDRDAHAAALREAGADAVVGDLGQVQITQADDATPATSAWLLVFEGFDPDAEGVREALCTLGNGYFATRGAAIESDAQAGVHYPGTYLAGGYNRLHSTVEGRIVENEDLVNLPNWLSLRWRIGDAPWFDAASAKLLSYRQTFDLRRGLLLREIRVEDPEGRITLVAERRFVSMHNMNLAAIELTLLAENWTGAVSVRSSIDGGVENNGAELYRRFAHQHLEPASTQLIDAQTQLLCVKTCQSELRVAIAARMLVYVDGVQRDVSRTPIDDEHRVGQSFTITLNEGETLALEKTCAVHSSRDLAISEPAVAATKTIARSERFEVEFARHALAWKHLWRHFDMRIRVAPQGQLLAQVQLQALSQPLAQVQVHAQSPLRTGPGARVAMLLRLNMCHLLQAVSPNSIGLDFGVPARGWTGEAYQGHVFWDELFIFPFFNFRVPEITRNLLLYRYRRLPEARAAATLAGFSGAMFPWQSGSDGQEETQVMNLNPRSQRWVPDHSWRQRHVGSAVAFNVWQYFQVTHDTEFLSLYGAELMIEIARFWASIAQLNATRGRYDISGVMGPDEFHDGYPGADTPGLKNNAYTNLMAVWVLWRARELLDRLPVLRRIELTSRLGITAPELEHWDDVSRRMFVPFHDGGIISQFEGYEDLLEFDWAGYRTRYDNIQRLDLILESENDSANRYKLSKQADVLMLFYLFSAEELGELFARLDYPFAPAIIPRNVAYYVDRTSHGSTLCRVVNAWVLARSDRPRSAQLFQQALQSDVGDIQQGTTAEGIHLGAMAGTADLVQRVWTGLELEGDMLRFNPELPPPVERFDMRLRYRGHSIDLRLTQTELRLRADESRAPSITVRVGDECVSFGSGDTRCFALAPVDAPSLASL